MPRALERLGRDWRRLGRDWRLQVIVTVYFGVLVSWQVWLSLAMSARNWDQTVWVATDNIAYFGWGALAGFFLLLIPLFALAALVKQHPLPAPPQGHEFHLRDKPMTVFLAGLSIGAGLGGVAIIAALVVAEVKVGWPVVWSIGFAAAIAFWIPLVYLGFYFRARALAQASPT